MNGLVPFFDAQVQMVSRGSSAAARDPDEHSGFHGIPRGNKNGMQMAIDGQVLPVPDFDKSTQIRVKTCLEDFSMQHGIDLTAFGLKIHA